MGGMAFVLRGGRALARRGGPMAAGLLALCAIVWFAGPRVGLTDATDRLWIIAGIVALGMIALLLRWLLVRHRGRKLQAELAAQTDAGAAAREADIAAIREKMDAAVQSLKTSELGGGHRGAAALYTLPWYMIIGPSAAGKSTLLGNSGLHFPLSDSQDARLRGYGGTRNCDWWFSDQAVLLDTAGRYTTEEDDREEWLTFLRMLRRHRRRLPINGVLVAISVSDVLTADSAALERHVKIIRERIDELIRELGLVFPVYLVFTKCDLIQGFEAYFSDLGESEREQVWGAYLLDAAGPDVPLAADAFAEHMQTLHQRLCELRLRKLSMQRSQRRKAELYDFPSQFLAARETLGEFVRLLFRANPYQETPLLAGVYFTSSTQEGTPLQRALGGLRQAFGLAPAASTETGEKRPYFIKRLFTDVIFQLPGAVRSNRRRLIWGRWLKGSAVAAALGIIGLTLAGLSGAYTANALLLSEGRSRVAAAVASAGTGAPIETYRELEALHEYRQRLLGHRAQRPWPLRLGVYSAGELMPGVEEVLFRLLGSHFRDPVLTALEYRLENHSRQWQSAEPEAREALRQAYYTSLRTYLAAARFHERLDLDSAAGLASDLWARRLGLVDGEQGHEAARERAPHLVDLARYYLQRLEQEPALRGWPLREGLVAQAREQLSTPPDAERLYARIRHRGLGELGSLSMQDLLTGENRGLLSAQRRLQRFYSAEGWYGFTREALDDVIATASRGDWVLSAPLDGAGADAAAGAPTVTVDAELAAELKNGIRRRYFSDYARHWLSFLGAARPKAPASLDEAATLLLRLARSDGPVGELMQVTARNINLYDLPDAGVGGKLPKEFDARPRVPELEGAFSDLRRFANPSENKSTSDLINQYLLLLTELKNATERLAASADLSRDAERYAARLLSGRGSDTEIYRVWVSTASLLNGTGAETQEAIKPLLTLPVTQLWRQVVSLARRHIEARWRADVVSAYRGRLASRFPFVRDGEDAAIEDVGSFFQPGGGILWSFVDETLAPYLEPTRGGWRQRAWLGVRPGFSREFLENLATARRISEAFFRKGGTGPEVVFHVYPVPTSGLSEILLESNGQAYRYRNGPQQWRRFNWPGDQQRIGARVSGTISRGAALAELQATGPWGLFHLLDAADLTAESSNIFRARWRIAAGSRDPVPVRFRVRTDQDRALFSGELLRRFKPPRALFAAGTDMAAALAEVR